MQIWNAAEYAANGPFVATMASAVVEMLAPRAGERILDAGCGDGALTAEIAASGAEVRGVDVSAGMAEAARARGLTVDLGDLTDLPYRGEFDAVFSNAALHWVPLASQPRLLASLHRALRPGGRLVVEMGGQGNIAAIRTALAAVVAPLGLDAEAISASFYPSVAHYRHLLEGAGFAVGTIELIPRPTPLPHGADGMTMWLNTFRNGLLDRLEPAARADALEKTVEMLRPILADALTGSWTADYVRLRFGATRA